MLIDKILDQKGRHCATVRPDATVATAVSLLAEHRIGAIVVEDLRGGVVGIFSERDLVKLLANRGPDALIVKVREAMSAPVITCKPDDRVDTVMEIMSDRRIRHMPVVSGDRLIGMISIRDLVRHRLIEKETEAAVLLDLARLHG
jgi:CBS domain-containing protein